MVELPNKVALRRADAGELLGLLSYELDTGFNGGLVFKAKTSELLEYYARKFGARRAAAYDPFWMIIWEDAAEWIIAEFRRYPNG